MNKHTKSVEEIVEELFLYISEIVFKKGKNWRLSDCLDVKKKITQTLQAERQRCEEELGEYRPAPIAGLNTSVDGRLYALVEIPQVDIEICYKIITQPNNPKA